MKYITTKKPKQTTLLTLVNAKQFPAWLNAQPNTTKQWVKAHQFVPQTGSALMLPQGASGASSAVAVISATPDIWSLAHLPAILPELCFTLQHSLKDDDIFQMVMGWEMACYHFERYKTSSKKHPSLYVAGLTREAEAAIITRSITLARDLINTPTNDMAPSHLAEECQKVAKECGAKFNQIVGDALLVKNYPTIHAVGRASATAPRLLDMRWGNTKHPKVTLVGKGVCFDSGGLDIKSSGNMKLMKKDMGGAAIVLALARCIMLLKLPVYLRVLIPAVENSISGNAFRPMDIITTRKGTTVEIGNTDAEGRLILCDALAEADTESPDLLIDCATLTGAARVALGTDIPAIFSNQDSLAQQLQAVALKSSDPMWQLPLWEGYREQLNTPIADLNNAPDGGYAGAITAALFLREFVNKKTPWLHIDVMAWNTSNRPGRPVGAEAMGVRALLAFIQQRYSKRK